MDAIMREVSKNISVPDPMKGFKPIDMKGLAEEAFCENNNDTLPEPTYDSNEIKKILGSEDDDDDLYNELMKEEKIIIINKP